MGFWQSVKAWLATEAEEAKDAGGQLQERLSSDLDRREKQLNETPAEAMERLQREIAENESTLGSIGDKVAYDEIRADAEAEVDAEAGDDVMDLPSEEVD